MMRVLLAILGVFAAAPALAQEIDCANTEFQIEMTACAEQDWMAADADLNAAYKAAMAALKQIDTDLPAAEQGAVAQLRDAQRAWVTFRDANCAAEGYSFHGGSAEPMVIYDCRARLTQQRAEDLWSFSAEQ